MKRAIAGLLVGLLVLSLAACHEREVQTQQTPETMQEEAPAPEAKPEEKMPAAPETEPGQEAPAVGLSEIFSSEMGVASAAELDEEARAYLFDFAARWRLDLLPVPTDGVWPERDERVSRVAGGDDTLGGANRAHAGAGGDGARDGGVLWCADAFQ